MTADGERAAGWDFAGVDRSGLAGECIGYLDRARSHGYAVARRRRSFALLEVHPGARVLDVGCGAGEEVLELAAVVGDTGTAVGLDLSVSLAQEARARAAERGMPVRLCAGDAQCLPFGTGLFDACRADRTLVYVADPAAAVAEMARVLAPGGRMVLAEPDWETLVFDTPEGAATRGVRAAVLERFPSADVGRRLKGILVACGLVDVEVEGWAFTEGDFDQAQSLFALPYAARQAVAAGTLAAEAASAWLASLEAAAARGGFFCSLTSFMACGRKPG